MTLTPFLKRVLVLDSASCLTTGALLTIGSASLEPLFGIDRAIIGGAGMALVPIGLFILWLGSRAGAPAGLVWAVILGNLLWTAESLILISSTNGITPLGTAFVSAQAAMVAGLAWLEWIGLRRGQSAEA